MKLFLHLSTLLLLIATLPICAQTKERLSGNTIASIYPKTIKKERYNIAVLTPMYLDSFDLAKNLTNIPSYAVPGLDFYQGIRIAKDTLDRMHKNVNIYVFDSKSKYLNINTLIETDKLDSMDCIIGNVGGAELKTIVEFAKEHKINFMSAVSPADADQKNNPFFTLLQPRLNTHIERIHKKIENNYSTDNIVFGYRNVPNEMNAFGYYKNDYYTKSTTPVKEYVIPPSGIDEIPFTAMLNKNVDNIFVMGILDEKVAYNNLKIIAKLASDGYRIKVFGMPTWKNIKALEDENEFVNVDIFYTTPMIVEKVTVPSIYIQNKYKAYMGSAPTEIVYKGFEAIYYATHLLENHGVPFNDHLNDTPISFITPYRILPVKEDFKLKYYENKFLYLVRFRNGIMTYE
jgi:hypothetical protein